MGTSKYIWKFLHGILHQISLENVMKNMSRYIYIFLNLFDVSNGSQSRNISFFLALKNINVIIWSPSEILVYRKFVFIVSCLPSEKSYIWYWSINLNRTEIFKVAVGKIKLLDFYLCIDFRICRRKNHTYQFMNFLVLYLPLEKSCMNCISSGFWKAFISCRRKYQGYCKFGIKIVWR